MSEKLQRLYEEHIHAAHVRVRNNLATIRECLKAIRADRALIAQMTDELEEARPVAAE